MSNVGSCIRGGIGSNLGSIIGSSVGSIENSRECIWSSIGII